MRIDTVTKYRCNGCGDEKSNPAGWMNFAILHVSGPMVFTAGTSISEDYCAECVAIMRGAAKRER